MIEVDIIEWKMELFRVYNGDKMHLITKTIRQFH